MRGEKKSTSRGENGRVVGWCESAGIFVTTDGCAVSEQGAGQKNQRINCGIFATDCQISIEKTGGCFCDSDGFLNLSECNIMSPLNGNYKHRSI